MKELKQGFMIFIVFSILTGIIYPVFITIVAQIFLKEKANGSLIMLGEKIIGSKLIGQKFINSKYFHGRPSAVDYSGDISGASNLGPTSKKLFEMVKENIDKTRIENAISPNTKLPADLILSSASGLDPDISVESALLQAHRIATQRKISLEDVKKIVNRNTEKSQFGFLGNERVNVLKLNLELDE